MCSSWLSAVVVLERECQSNSDLWQLTRLSPTSHEARPEDPEEKGSQQRKDVGHFGCCDLIGSGNIVHVERSADTETKEGSEHVEEDRVTDIEGEEE